MALNIRLDAFEGPFDLLYHLIEKNKIDIYDIPIAELTDQYLGYLEDIGEEQLDTASEFLVMAATLLSIKSKLLLPSTHHEVQLEIAAGNDEADPRDELVYRLIQYKKYKDISLILRQMEKEQLKLFRRQPEDITHFYTQGFLLEGVTFEDVLQVFRNLCKTDVHRKERHHSVKKDPMPLSRKIKEIFRFIKNKKSILFSNLLKPNHSKLDYVVTFLAMLQLIKMNRILAKQEKFFGDITVALREDR